MRKTGFAGAIVALSMVVFGAQTAEPIPGGMPVGGPGLRIINPVQGSIAPANWFFPVIEWEDDAAADAVYSVAIDADGKRLRKEVRGRRFAPDAEAFAPFLGRAEVTVSVERGDVKDSIVMATDGPAFTDTVVYRLVEPLFNPGQDGIVRTFSMRERGAPELLRATGTCIGCHAYGDDGAVLNARLGMDRRLFTARPGGDGGYVFGAKNIGEFSFVAPRPSSRALALCVGTRSTIRTRKRVYEPFDMVYASGDIAIIEGDGGEPLPLRGASSPEYVEDMPAASPDGLSLVFARYAPASDAFRQGPIVLHLLGLGDPDAQAVPLMKEPPSAYCYFPKWSPDGRWISFVSADASRSYFARDSSDIWLYSVADGATRKLECNADGAMDSWHAWSSDSRWLVFSSKRRRSGLTALYLARVDEEGRAAQPVMLVGDDAMKINLPFTVPAGASLDYGPAFGQFIRVHYGR